jgi:hypothetical protein
MAASLAVGELLASNSEAFRACANKNFLTSSRTEIRDRAYYRKEKDTDGLSLGLTADDAVRNLDDNFGVIMALVKDIHQLPGRNLEVRSDPGLDGHAILHGLPYKEAEEQLAEDIAWELVKISRIIHSNSYYPQGHHRHKP